MTLDVAVGPFEYREVALDLWAALVRGRPHADAQAALAEHILDVLADAGVDVGELDAEIVHEIVADTGAEHVQVLAGWIIRAARAGAGRRP